MSRLENAVLLIDGDILAYRAAAATDGRQYKVEYLHDGQQVTVYEKYKKDADKLAKQVDATVTLEYDPEPVENAIHVLEKSIVSLETLIGPHAEIGEAIYFCTNKGSFREKVFPAYKKNRDGMRKPAHLMACKEHLLTKYNGRCRAGEFEADDLMAIFATELKEEGRNAIICSIDKDLLQVPGYHFNFVKGVFSEVDEVEALRSLYSQMLIGDATDGIPGLYGVGPVTAKKLLKDAVSEYMMYCIVLKEYLTRSEQEEGETFEAFTERIVATVSIHAQLLYLLRSEEDKYEVPEA